MITLQKGNQLPTVAVVQSCLNQVLDGENIVVDGVFGQQTKRSISRWQSKNRKAQTGMGDYSLWEKVVGPEWQIVDFVDRAAGDSEHEDVAPFGQTVLEQFGMSRGSRTAINRIIASARQREVILLRFHGHGSPGNMIVASGKESHLGSELHSSFHDNKNFIQFIRRLGPIFAPMGSIEMHGCRVGRGAPGKTLLRTMAEAIGVPVTAALNRQYGGGSSSFRFEGTTRTICPGGKTLKQWANSVCQTSFRRPSINSSTAR